MTVKKVRELAKQRGISLSFICKQIGVASPYFIDLEKSDREIPDKKLKEIANVLFTTPEYLKGETDNPDIPKEPTAIFEDERQAELNAIFERMPDESSKDNMLDLVRFFELTNKHQYIVSIEAKGGNKPIVHRIPSESGRPQNEDALLRGGAAAFGGDSATIELDEKDLEEYHKMHSINYQEDTSEK